MQIEEITDVRHRLTDQEWEELSGFVPKETRYLIPARTFLDSVFWVLATGAPWRDLPPRFGKWNSAFKRFSRWREAGVFESMFAISGNRKTAEAAMDSTSAKAHKASAGYKKTIRKLLADRAAG